MGLGMVPVPEERGIYGKIKKIILNLIEVK